MGRGNSDIIYFLEQHKQEIINCCKKGMSNNEVKELLKRKYGREVADATYRKFKAKLNLTKNDFLETMLDEIVAMKTSGATDASVRRWLAEEHEVEVSRATFSRFKKKYNLVATTDSTLYAAVLNDVTYLTYSDPECQNPVTDLSVYEGLKSVTLYATELVFDDEVRYTVTEEEWNAWTTHKNYTIEQYYGNIDHFIIKYTDNAIEFEQGDRKSVV